MLGVYCDIIAIYSMTLNQKTLFRLRENVKKFSHKCDPYPLNHCNYS